MDLGACVFDGGATDVRQARRIDSRPVLASQLVARRLHSIHDCLDRSLCRHFSRGMPTHAVADHVQAELVIDDVAILVLAPFLADVGVPESERLHRSRVGEQTADVYDNAMPTDNERVGFGDRRAGSGRERVFGGERLFEQLSLSLRFALEVSPPEFGPVLLGKIGEPAHRRTAQAGFRVECLVGIGFGRYPAAVAGPRCSGFFVRRLARGSNV